MGFRILTVLLTAFAVYSKVTCLPSNDWHFQGQNVAFGKRASQRPATFKEYNPYYTSYSARLAVDGNDNNDFSQQSCSHTTSSEKIDHIAQWRVDLGYTYDITGIVIINRKDYRERLKYFIIYGKNYNVCREWCELYNDRYISAYKNATIRIAINNRQSYHTIVINLPKIDGVPDSGGFNLTLCEVKIFEAPRHVCKIPKRSDIRNVVIYETTGLLVNGLYTVGTILQFFCVHGFLINGPNFVKCLSGGEFNQTLPVCTAACKIITIGNGRMYPLQTLYTVNSHATIECSEGYSPQIQEITCQYGGNWNHYEQCKQVLCDYPRRPHSGYYISHSTSSIIESLSLPYGSIITGRCYDGYEGNDNDTRVCNGNNTWSGMPLTCTIKECPHPGYVTNGLYILSNGSSYLSGSSVFDTTIEIKCNKGFVVNGSKSLGCSSNKTWKTRRQDKKPATCIESGTEEEKNVNVIVIVVVSAAATVIFSATSSVAFFLYRRKRCLKKENTEANMYTDLSSQSRNADGEYTDIQETHFCSNKSSVEKETTSTQSKDDPFYCNTAIDRITTQK